MADGTISTFRQKRGRLLAGKIKALADLKQRPVTVLDVGGRRDYWDNVGFDGIGQIVLINIDPADLGRATSRKDVFIDRIGDARKLDGVADQAFDFYHSNSVIEHVGSWTDMKSMAREARRVAGAGWLQTPAWEFPLEPHFRLPFMHWLATPARTALLSFARSYRGQDHDGRRQHAERINLLSKSEVRLLFPSCRIETERFLLLAKSYIVQW
jgi:Methyltransferase domain